MAYRMLWLLGMNTANIELLRNRAIARAAAKVDARAALSFALQGGHYQAVKIASLESAAAEGEAAGALFALREAEHDQAVAS